MSTTRVSNNNSPVLTYQGCDFDDDSSIGKSSINHTTPVLRAFDDQKSSSFRGTHF